MGKWQTNPLYNYKTKTIEKHKQNKENVMAKRDEQSTGVYIQEGAKIFWGVMLALNIAGAILLVVFYPIYGIIIAAVLLALGIPLLRFIVLCLTGFGELIEDTHCIRNSNAEVAIFVDQANIAKQRKNSSGQ